MLELKKNYRGCDALHFHYPTLSSHPVAHNAHLLLMRHSSAFSGPKWHQTAANLSWSPCFASSWTTASRTAPRWSVISSSSILWLNIPHRLNPHGSKYPAMPKITAFRGLITLEDYIPIANFIKPSHWISFWIPLSSSALYVHVCSHGILHSLALSYSCCPNLGLE